MKTRPHLVFVLGDQLDFRSPALTDFDSSRDHAFMAEARDESTRVVGEAAHRAFTAMHGAAVVPHHEIVQAPAARMSANWVWPPTGGMPRAYSSEAFAGRRRNELSV